MRQRLFGEHDVNHINQYHKLFKEGVATEPMPHLFIVPTKWTKSLNKFAIPPPL
jgi:S-DNA-T family DNA segregation ATPase FtsK/SpoIIIE